jgi:hypothetical protein
LQGVNILGKNDLLEKINVDTIHQEALVDGKKSTVLRLFRLKILFIHDRKGRAILTYRGSVNVRMGTLKKLKMGPTSSLPLEIIGKTFGKVSGQEDDKYIVSRLERNIPVDEIIIEFLQEVRNNLNIP